MLNHIVIMGRLTRDPELRRTGSGLAVASFSVAVERDYPSQETGQREVDFIDCVAWRQTGEFVSKWFTKGSMIVVSGRLQIRPWTDKDGNKRRTAEIVADNVYFGENKKDREANTVDIPSANAYSNPYNAGTANYGAYPSNYTPSIKPAVTDWDLLDDDDAQLPF